jgi:hypothetical protein
MNELERDRELDEILDLLKDIEHKMINDGDFMLAKDIFSIHLAVIHGYYDMNEALEFIECMYKGDAE